MGFSDNIKVDLIVNFQKSNYQSNFDRVIRINTMSKQFYFKSSDKTPVNNSSGMMRRSADKKDFVQAHRPTTDEDYFNRRVQTEFDEDFESELTQLKKYGYISNCKPQIKQPQPQSNKAYRKYGTIYDDHKQKKVITGAFVMESPKNRGVIINVNPHVKLGLATSHSGMLKKVSGKLVTEPSEKLFTGDKFLKKDSKEVFEKLLMGKDRNIKHESIKSNKSKQFRSTNLESYGSKQKHVIGGKIESKVKDITNLITRYKNISNNYGLRESTKKDNPSFKPLELKKTNDKSSKLHLKTEPCESKKPDVEIIEKIGEGTFGKVYKATMGNKVVAIKKVFQDKKYKNRELQILKMIKNDFVLNVIQTYYTQEKEKKGEVKEYLNVVMEFYKQNLYEAYSSDPSSPLLPIEIKLYMYQLFRGLMYIHSLDICHRDIKPQNLLVNRKNYRLVICDFGSAKKLIKGEENIAYICSRCYRAPELIFDCSNYTTMIDIWSAGCVMLQLLTGQPFFLGDSNVGQLVQIIKILGTPSKTEVINMNPEYDLDEYKFPKVKTRVWRELFPEIDPKVQSFLKEIMIYSPKQRLNAAEALAHEYFDELRQQQVYHQLVKSKGIFPLFNFAKGELLDYLEELKGNQHLVEKLVPEWYHSYSGSGKYS